MGTDREWRALPRWLAACTRRTSCLCLGNDSPLPRCWGSCFQPQLMCQLCFVCLSCPLGTNVPVLLLSCWNASLAPRRRLCYKFTAWSLIVNSIYDYSSFLGSDASPPIALVLLVFAGDFKSVLSYHNLPQTQRESEAFGDSQRSVNAQERYEQHSTNMVCTVHSRPGRSVQGRVPAPSLGICLASNCPAYSFMHCSAHARLRSCIIRGGRWKAGWSVREGVLAETHGLSPLMTQGV